MTSLLRFFETPGALLLVLLALFLPISQTAVFLLSVRERKSRRQTIAAALHLLAGFLLFVILLDGYDIVNFPDSITREADAGRWLWYSVPWPVYAALELLSAGVVTLRFLEYRRYRFSTVTPGSIRQTVDLLPEGICVSAAEGTVLLENLKMDSLCRELTGERLFDAHRFWSFLEQKGEDQDGERLVHTPLGEVWLFSREKMRLDDGDYERISAIDVTERYRITEELREKNAHLRDIQRRLEEAADLSTEMFVKQEEARARTALHNELGQVLLMGRHYLEHPESTEVAMVALMTSQMNRFLLGESKAPAQEAEDELRQAVRIADGIGVSVTLQGEAPQEDELRFLLAQAIRECAANAVKHAEGNALEVTLSEDVATRDRIITIRNNGKPPRGPIAESGGLLSLRRSVEAAGGEMRVQSLPEFCLSLRFPAAAGDERL